ncbi:hypothetical protein IDM40_21980 [Nocardiopsis sp. HNM0947]|uniref:Uncharacterized protein n=1 Tax=Nocardiopsis coralli TaxID=2772213 RepID=A0ABR9PC86_9ACTN|nr:DUF6086 family protein [Nocardiopsis coralli]MBE3001340.1 hypothetical protein [Nocardiopsis coralli]
MSKFFDVDGRTVWSPASGRAERFMERVAMLERELGVPSGIAPVLADEHDIDGAVFGAFVAAMLAREGPGETGEGTGDTAAVLLVLAERAGLDAGAAAWDPRWFERARAASRCMPR